MVHLRVWNGNSDGVLVLAVPGVLYSVHLSVIELGVGHILPPG